MPQLDCYLAQPDEEDLVTHVLDLGGWLVPSIDYPSSEPVHVRDLEAFRKYRRQTDLFLVLSTDYVTSPLEMAKHPDGPKAGKCFIMQRNGGPTIDLFCPKVFSKRNMKYLPPAMLGYYRTYWDTHENANLSTPKALIQFFRAITDRVKGSGTRVKVGARTYWIAHHAALARGAELRLTLLDE